jgi:hypothetical protein
MSLQDFFTLISDNGYTPFDTWLPIAAKFLIERELFEGVPYLTVTDPPEALPSPTLMRLHYCYVSLVAVLPEEIRSID